MKENGLSLLSNSEHSVTRLQRLNLTDAQLRDAVTYEPGQIVEFHRMARGVVRSGIQARWAMHVFTDSKVALRDAVARPSKRLSAWELLVLAKQNRTLKAELARQRAKAEKQQQEIAYER